MRCSISQPVGSTSSRRRRRKLPLRPWSERGTDEENGPRLRSSRASGILARPGTSRERVPGLAHETVTLLLASRNQNKLRELRAALPSWDIALVDAPDDPVEDGATFLDNARIKARHGRLHGSATAWVAGEDSGIEVAALGGRPGVESARWAEDGVARLLAELQGASDRRARYVCELVVLDPSGVELKAAGVLEGEIAVASRGHEGFGYDPIFVPRGESLTVAELGDSWKAAHSHRAQAARALAQLLAER
jgi:XTP/dITP diphosphohydrolase